MESSQSSRVSSIDSASQHSAESLRAATVARGLEALAGGIDAGNEEMLSRSRRQGLFWMLTVPATDEAPPWTVGLPKGIKWIKGQQETGETTGYLHWQVVVAFERKQGLRGVKRFFGNVHAELTRSEAAESYVWKDETHVPGTRFTFGAKPIRVDSKTDWESVWLAAQRGDLMCIPPRIRVISYRTLRTIGAAYDSPSAIVREVSVYWGLTGTGKSRRAWAEAGMDAYCKDPRSKFWCGYQGEEHVIIDEFRGGIDIAHLLRWTDRYPVRVEIKGSSVPLVGNRIWFTSNLEPKYWYPEADTATLDALMRRLNITEML